MMVIATDAERCDASFAEIFDSNAYDEIVHKYKDIIEFLSDRCEFFI